MNVIDEFMSKENVLTVRLDQSGRIVDVNPVFEKIFESTSDELRGKPLTAITLSLHDAQQSQPIKIFILQDVPEKKNSRKQIEFLASISEHNSAPIFSVNSKNEIIYKNPAATLILENWEHKLHQSLPSRFMSLINMAITNQKEYLVEEGFIEEQYLFSITPGSFDTANIYGTNITARKEAENELLYLSHYDMLTQLYNRTSFEDALKNEIEWSHKHDTSFAILLLDLDNFKIVNDTFGHSIGDRLLIQVANQLKRNVRKNDIVARFGGDEFVILLSNLKNINEVDAFARHLIKRFNKPFKLDNHYFHATISMGIALSGKDESTLLQNADIALYTVKELGRNNYQFFSDDIHSEFKQRADLETNLPNAITNNEFYLVYQPQYKLLDKEIIGIEVLLRWNHPKLGLVMPNVLIPLAERNGFIIPIGEWVLKHACKQYVIWQKAGLIPNNIKLAINLSSKHITKEKFLKSLKKIIKETSMPAHNLEFELTEVSVMTNTLELDHTLRAIQEMGIGISIDNFGAGYSSLSRLKELAVNTLKIDKSFISNLSEDPQKAMIVKSIVAFGNSLGINVISEGVETKEQVDLLMQYECSAAQGFYFVNHPLNSDEMKTLLQKNFT